MDINMLPDEIHPSWDTLLEDAEFIEELQELSQMNPSEYYPHPKDVMRFLSNDLSRVKCVIVGMEPYASGFVDESGDVVPQATGRSFEVGSLTKQDDWQVRFRQSSLQNIIKSIYLADTGKKASMGIIRQQMSHGEWTLAPPSELFDALERQGVMFLNASLTVERGRPASHQRRWESPMRKIISHIEEIVHPVWMLWGRDAQERVRPIVGASAHVIEACHPRLAAFVDADVLSQVDDIDWTCMMDAHSEEEEENK